MQLHLLNDIVVILALAIGILLVCHRVRVPAIVGFLVTGVLAGPHGLGLIRGVHEVESLAEIGVVLLLFTIGLEFSMRSLWQLKRLVLLGGTLQVFATLVCTCLIAWKLDYGVGESIFFGFLVSLSSTAIVLKLLQERAEMDSPQGRIALSILIFQDIIAVPMMLLIPLMAEGEGEIAAAFITLLVKGISIVVLALISAKWGVPHLLYLIARTRSRELFLLTVVVMCLAVAWLTSSIGLSLALGAFLAGLIISESEYSYQALSNLLPFRDLFTSIFFISVGMLVNVGTLIDHPLMIFLITISILFLKSMIGGTAALILGYPLRTMVLSGLALNQVGEFSFILAKTGVDHGLLSASQYPVFLVVSVLSMVATPFIIAAGPRTADILARIRLPGRLHTGLFGGRENGNGQPEAPADHLLIIGYGVNGRNVSRAARSAGIPYLIVEMNPVTVKNEKAKGEPIYFGDGGREAVLDHAGVRRARVMVVAIPDPVAVRMVVASARSLNPRLHIIARTRYLQEMETLYQLGANEVIPEEFETSVEIFSRVLARYLVPRDEIESFVAEVRSDGYGMFRSLSEDSTSFCTTSFCDYRLYLPDVEIRSYRVKESAPICGKSLAEIGLRKRHEVSLLAIRRNSETISNPGADTVLHPEDISVLVGTPDRLNSVRPLFGM